MYALNMVILNAYWAVVNMFEGKNEEGQGMVEYGLIIALIAVVLIVALGLVGGSLNATFSSIKNSLAAAYLIATTCDPTANQLATTKIAG